MLEIPASQRSPALAALFRDDEPGALRLFGPLDGAMPGQFLTDDPTHPTWVIAREAVFGSLFFGGAVTAEIIAAAITLFKPRPPGEVLVAMRADDPRIALLPAERDYDGWQIDFDQRAGDLSRFAVPSGLDLRRMDAALWALSNNGQWVSEMFGEGVTDNMIGYALMQGDTVVSESAAGVPVRGVCEMGVDTLEAERGKGYATVVCAAVIRDCEAAGYATYWNCAVQNLPSAALARRLGYQRERPSRVIGWL